MNLNALFHLFLGHCLTYSSMTDPDVNTLALGTDLTSLGLNLNSPEILYSSFVSPWAEVRLTTF